MKNQMPDTQYRSLSLRSMSFAFLVLGMGFKMAILAFVIQIAYCKSDKITRQIRNNFIENEPSSKIVISSIDVNKRRPIKGESDNDKKKIIEAASHETGLLVDGTDTFLKLILSWLLLKSV